MLSNGRIVELENNGESGFEMAIMINSSREQNGFTDEKDSASLLGESKDKPSHSDGKTTLSDETELADDVTPDDILLQLGGCGRFQLLITVTIQILKSVVCWGMIGNSFFAFVPNWRCMDNMTGDEASSNTTTMYPNIEVPGLQFTNVSLNGNSSTNETYWNMRCETLSGHKCKNFQFEGGMSTLVNEFNLVCELSWVTASITSIQMAGMCVGSVFGGQIADFFGRKNPIMFSMALLSVFHFVCFFSSNWIMFAIARFFIGVGSSIFLTIYCILQSEFLLSKWRSMAIGFPSWALESSVFAFVAWLLPDWRYLSLVMALMAMSYLASWFWVPESFRWYYANDRQTEAEDVIKIASKWNRHPVPDMQHMRRIVNAEIAKNASTKKHTLLEVFRRRDLLKLTLPLSVTWLTMGLVAYGINFGIKKLAGSIYMNLFVFSIASFPSKLFSIYLQNKIGRKKAGMFAFAICFIGGVVVGVIQYIDTPYRDALTNYFALAASVGVDGAWGPMQTITLELYPTVVRNASFGLLSVLARFGAVIGPQFVFLSELVPGILYFIVGLTSLLSVMSLCCLPETMDTNLVDKLEIGISAQRKKEHHV